MRCTKRMTTEQEQIIADVKTDTVQPGTLLKAKREALGLTQKQVADRLRLRLSIIQSLEENNFASDQVATFTRGYLRSYAKAVGIKESVILASFDDCYPTVVAEQPMQSFSKKTKREKHDSRIMTLTWGIFAIIIGISSLWWWQNQEQENVVVESSPSITSTSVERLRDEDFTTVPELVPTVDESQVEAEAVDIPVEINTQAAELIPSPEDDTAEADLSASNDPVLDKTPPQDATNPYAPLTLTFSADCWIQVKDAAGKTLSTGIKKSGQTVTLQGEAPFQIILGAPESVSMTFASEPVDLSGYTSGKVARFTLP
ncbi:MULTISPECIES: cytoskeleton protein RodZ [unclassified Vibrio]|uniref:cytoskeleton protein RodZ n=1 Tax=unclassified Vibrio TaxID=2614977 RepID=UPI000B8E8C5D|nr:MULTISPECIES: cytoskeleton protein RodZ [unclassified Vibrio]NAW90332.1 cytoskeleton protein RodZ [Vibrio sp. V24_P1S3T111]NAX19398.1 cytoskeleton protein RodZ [Vibrio sp. V22_P2S10T140]OXX20564.1 helix-turn-helix domain-containing protein [Vibrio sp. V06_P1A73T115]OXX26875.1 helix-turn-helix domain-containing protein [Vibrio sp. V05_P4A8T149]OXX35824.1 helix-turn-helix domain-containing protein [Vibrio sp. V14_P6S14T42]